MILPLSYSRVRMTALFFLLPDPGLRPGLDLPPWCCIHLAPAPGRLPPRGIRRLPAKLYETDWRNLAEDGLTHDLEFPEVLQLKLPRGTNAGAGRVRERASSQ